MERLSKARWKKEKWDRPSISSILSKYADKPGFFFHMSDLGPDQRGSKGSRLGINPKSRYKTPLGVYAYPLTRHMVSDLLSDNLPFRQEAPWVHVFYANPSHLLYLQEYSARDLERDKEKLGLYDSTMEDGAKVLTPGGKIWNITRLFNRNQNRRAHIRGAEPPPSIAAWAKLFLKLGYGGVVDLGEGIIHSSEPTQAVIFNPRIIKPVEVLPNPSLEGGYMPYNQRSSDLWFKGWIEGPFHDYTKSFTVKGVKYWVTVFVERGRYAVMVKEDGYNSVQFLTTGEPVRRSNLKARFFALDFLPKGAFFSSPKKAFHVLREWLRSV